MSTQPTFVPGSTFDYLMRATQGGVAQDMTGWGASLAIGHSVAPVIGGAVQPVLHLIDVAVVWTGITIGEGRFTVSSVTTDAWPDSGALRLQVTLTSPTGAVTIGMQQTLHIGSRIEP